MLLSVDTVMRTVFMIFAGFWLVVIAILLLGVGALLKRQERLLQKSGHGQPPTHH